ncbi:capsular biosynthesis protein [Heyndrickxia shackletonii]|uniref:Capsular biosynthesis protein n=1 Tax=Heyndrickxia shackletonii TaxID=157838 RepID=A0A0Q3WYE2_9BACI|nr:CapA family protein [Heyndrickxia shackletonii]KQL53983.1 capsular biosynthesis protein [Heyndrickxia shackletonii]MBB2478855.1 CapA family protein [Bacillus sp. APMAM]NEY97730.1 CapA family protein [Heyndrickxia shackletonii]RTZ57606.1 CapA family protein [Bacillus sp. SAJ1]
MRGKHKVAGILLLCLLVAIGVLFFIQFDNWKQAVSKKTFTVATNTTRTLSVKTKEFHSSAVIGGIGDVLIHDWVYEDAKTKYGYDFKPIFQNVKAIMKKPDLLIANQESTPGGAQLGVSSYPCFNSPYEIVDAIMDAGVDFVTTANNHVLDKGEKGLLSALTYYDKVHLPHVGTFKSKEDQETLRIENVNGIKIAILSYTYGTNGIPIPEGKDYLVNMIDKDKILAELKRARAQADVVVLGMHWGIEYQRQPNEEQQQLAKLFTDGGADIILGSHPHVLQPIQKFHTKDGRDAIVIYSLGNFISGQMWDYKDIGGMFEVKVTKDVTTNGNNIKLEDMQFYPTFVYNHKFKNYQLYPLQEAYAKGMADHSYKEIMEHMMGGIK